ncbi:MULTISPECIES: shufflon system plasmid conjugative transfer pilus tip adhesin PilV [unclassified Tatumella]|uniref:shufflon system plasmid conjugative transfer pilus tip adhesin PilV n=1 Tax=unclassified Tatumella TaxID=2649542 RepID=UPI001BB080A2|nr:MULTISPECIES: shufflon system plasmid conjugative transfer pilus tip adhesin PilV [unclassified Tatumella]MBS0855537.1 shufflon system plasmid conjugative transfer pilus tip adhesin PilV [Tatumella sp. JGM16]MBS0912314.1 shufflon system plasmid conjugative transfer pilus tip adhesin PilV [Tatumella sp. JGM91]
MIKIHRGDTLFSLSLVLALILIAAPIGYQRYSDYLQLQEWMVTARQTNIFSEAAEYYLKDHYADLQKSLLAEKVVAVTARQLQQQGYLGKNIFLKNNQGQQYSIFFTLDNLTNKNITGLLLSRQGDPLSEKGMRYIARLMHGESGYISEDNQATGVDGSWQINTALSGIPASRGHLAILLSADTMHSVFSESDRLYRYAVTGHPELNQMHADIDLTRHQLRNAGEITARDISVSDGVSSGNLSAKSGIWSGGNITAETDIRSVGGSLVTRGDKGWINSTHNGGFYMNDDQWVRVWKDKGISTAGEIQAGKISADGRMTAREYLDIKGSASLNTPCSDDGLIANGGSAGILICYNGQWVGFMKNNIHLTSLGGRSGIYQGVNGTGEMVWISASGGNTSLSRVAGDGYCYNFSDLRAMVNGILVANNSSQGKNITPSSSVIFAIPPGAGFSVVSHPAQAYGCGNGQFSLSAYQ